MSAETLDYHHGKHHKTYVDNLNKMIVDTEFANADLETVIKKSSGPLFNNAAQVWNHTFFWNCLTPKGAGEPGPKLSALIQRDFGSLDTFKQKFTEASIKQFGSGWGWLVQNTDGKLEVLSTSNAVNPLTDNRTPILTCDVWEHAYYIDYRNRRPDFLQAFWNLTNWDFAEKNLKA
jgi:Fe-Mn family superoxide dismutase